MIVNSTRDCIFFMLRNNFEFMLRDSCFVKKSLKLSSWRYQIVQITLKTHLRFARSALSFFKMVDAPGQLD
jgi:hypothetical protein